MPALFEVAGATKRYDGAAALGPITLTIDEGTTTALIGPSGAGKSTLLRMLNGLVPLDAGTVRFRGRPLLDGELPALRREMGYVIQGGGLFPHLDAASNVALVARYLSWEERRIEARIAELSELVRLPRKSLDRYPAQLSGGQAQRVGLMRALMLDPSVLLLDEPLGALDPITRFDLQEDLRSIFARLGKTVVLVTHDLTEAAFFSGRVVLLRDGRIVQIGEVAQLVSAPADEFVERFVHAQRALPC
jgi:osmoprotectant transport system ATP-binding protein